jgi:predicted transcriptional regulator
MTRTQIQLPDALYAQVKRIAERHETSLAELVRRGLEHMVRVYRASEDADRDWCLPEPLALGEFIAPVEDWRELASAPGSGDAEPA